MKERSCAHTLEDGREINRRSLAYTLSIVVIITRSTLSLTLILQWVSLRRRRHLSSLAPGTPHHSPQAPSTTGQKAPISERCFRDSSFQGAGQEMPASNGPAVCGPSSSLAGHLDPSWPPSLYSFLQKKFTGPKGDEDKKDNDKKRVETCSSFVCEVLKYGECSSGHVIVLIRFGQFGSSF